MHTCVSPDVARQPRRNEDLRVAVAAVSTLVLVAAGSEHNLICSRIREYPDARWVSQEKWRAPGYSGGE